MVIKLTYIYYIPKESVYKLKVCNSEAIHGSFSSTNICILVSPVASSDPPSATLGPLNVLVGQDRPGRYKVQLATLYYMVDTRVFSVSFYVTFWLPPGF